MAWGTSHVYVQLCLSPICDLSIRSYYKHSLSCENIGMDTCVCAYMYNIECTDMHCFLMFTALAFLHHYVYMYMHMYMYT